ncbi:hypothetical protein VA7868_00364 [Vibrio aerogenes CECT 7868]|uniref:Uncharacterized protein n=1 Tax=Vibrio aerogenes CECT 7868 TaxID=1216006 RepID=A0A1M5VEJ6_9VIBR|nr:hypothetical protein [Vibrio aerogenes]SHH73679.1 hypothetical protein VA7868_00364 [Vibrio aerogenes CECT 7868]
MRTFNENEQYIIDALNQYPAKAVVNLPEFFSQQFFTEKNKRALIIQPEIKYAVYYLPVERFNNEYDKKIAIDQFQELKKLMNYLTDNGYLIINKSSKDKSVISYFCQLFHSPHIKERKRLILNHEGLYSEHPRYIKDKDDNIILKGIDYQDRQYEEIFDTFVGEVFISESLQKIASKKKKNHQHIYMWIAFIFSAVALFGIFWAAYHSLISEYSLPFIPK